MPPKTGAALVFPLLFHMNDTHCGKRGGDMVKVMIVEDDPMVAELNRRYLSQVKGFQLAAVAQNSADALKVLEDTQVDLILLDIFLPGMNGLDLLSQLRNKAKGIDVIVVTAARDSMTITDALRYGAVDYLIKPFEGSRLIEALSNYRTRVETIQNKQLSQKELDKKVLGKENEQAKDMPKGLDRNTLRNIWRIISEREEDFDTREIADTMKISRVSMRKYLNYLQSLGIIKLNVEYGYVGRPTYKYRRAEDGSELMRKIF